MGVSQKNLARQLGIDPATLGKIELDRKLASRRIHTDLHRILGLDS